MQRDPLTYNPTKINKLAALTGAESISCYKWFFQLGYYCVKGKNWPIVRPAGTNSLNVGEVDVSGCI